MTHDEEIMAALINRRGYVVMASLLEFNPGETATTAKYGNFGGRPLETDNQLSIIGRTDYADFIVQHQLVIELGWWPNSHPRGLPDWNFYRVTTD